MLYFTAMSTQRIRKPGQDFQLTDEELLVAPLKLLSSAQRKRRRQLRNNKAKEKTRALQKQRNNQHQEVGAKVVFCMEKNKKGMDCSAYAMRGAIHCRTHLTKVERKRLGIEEGSGRLTRSKTKYSAPAMMKDVVEVAIEKLISRYFMALGLEFVGYDENNEPIVHDLGVTSGLRLHGESKEGVVHMSNFPDLVAQIQVIEKLNDRVYGKPRQTTVLEGGVKPIQVQPVRSVDRAQKVANLLRGTGAVHSGRQRRDPGNTDEPSGVTEHSNEEPSGSVVPLHKEDS